MCFGPFVKRYSFSSKVLSFKVSFETTVLSLIYAFSLGVVGQFFLFPAKLKLFRFYFL